MKFFFADSMDLVDPSFDFATETRSETRVRQRDDLYPHEIFAQPPYDGMLVSYAVVQGTGGKSSKYTVAQRQRFLRLGVRQFLRLDDSLTSTRLLSMGDCGAFAYVNEEVPPVSVEEVVEFYGNAGFDYGASVDHVILAYRPELDAGLPGVNAVPSDYSLRQRITLELAGKFLERHSRVGASFVPVGVAQGWSPTSYASAVSSLQSMGYRYIALGGMVSLKTREILECLRCVRDVKTTDVSLHLFGVTRLELLRDRLTDYGIASFDSTSPLRQAFKDDSDNYHTLERNYSALRVPQVDGSPKLHKLIRSGAVEYDEAVRLESESLRLLTLYDDGRTSVAEVLEALTRYQGLYEPGKDRTEAYADTLEHQPWKNCRCEVCRSVGINVVVFRGAERNRRRGFHNLWVLRQKLRTGSSEGYT